MILVAAVGLSSLSAAAIANAPSIVSGEAFGVSASSILINLTEFPDVVLAPAGGTASAAVAGLNLVGLLTTGTITVDTTGASAADADSTATVEQISVLGGIVPADVVTAKSASTAVLTWRRIGRRVNINR